MGAITLRLFIALGIAALVICEDDQQIQMCARNVSVTLIPELLKKGGVWYEKQAVDESVPIELLFTIPSTVDVKKINWRLHDDPIEVSEKTKRPIYYTTELVGSENRIKLVMTTSRKKFIGKWQMIVEVNNGPAIYQACFVTSPVLLSTFTDTVRAIEGSNFAVVCEFASIPPPTEVKWYRAISAADGSVNLKFIPSDGQMTRVPGDTLNLTVSKSDSGVYICNATGPGSTDSAAAELKIKSRFAVLWPFIGILIELIILLITIIVYEKHKAAKKKKSSESDPLLTTHVNAGGDTKASSPSHNVEV